MQIDTSTSLGISTQKSNYLFQLHQQENQSCTHLLPHFLRILNLPYNFLPFLHFAESIFSTAVVIIRFFQNKPTATLTSTDSVDRRLKIIKSERFSKCQSLMQRTEYPNARLLELMLALPLLMSRRVELVVLTVLLQ